MTQPADIPMLDADGLYREEVLLARKFPLARKVQAGFELFYLACEFTKAGIRSENPGADETSVLEILRNRLALGRRLEDRV